MFPFAPGVNRRGTFSRELTQSAGAATSRFSGNSFEIGIGERIASSH
jgi:hypothetical protein